MLLGNSTWRLASMLRSNWSEGKDMIGLIGKKLGMSQVFGVDGSLVPVTVIQTGPCKAAGVDPVVVLREFRIADVDDYEVGSELTIAQVFQPGELVNIIGRTKGRGYAGVIKRHGMSGFPGSHGTHESFRHGGSIGNRSFPGRIFKGKRMAGQYGNDQMTALHLRVVEVRPDSNLLLVRGSVPGAPGGIVLVRKA